MKAPAKPEVEWEATQEFKDSWKTFLAAFPQIKAAMTEFNRCKRATPPSQLPAKMSDHKLDGPLKGYMDCHLDNDVILIYKPMAHGAIKLLIVCQHKDLTGPRAKTLKKKIS